MRYTLPLLVLLGGAALPAVAQREARWLRGGGGLALQLVEEISLLQRLVPLQLTDQQLDQLLALYAQHPPQAGADQSEAVQKLQEIKQRLLAGTPLVATDLKTLRELMQEAVRRSRAEVATAPAAAGETAQAPPLTPLEQGLWDALTMPQRAILLGDVRGPAANNQKANQLVAQRAMTLIGKLRQADEPRWPQERDRLAEALAAGAGEPASAPRDNCRKLFVDFLDRLRGMPQADFAARQQELGAELLALLPPQTNLLVALAEFDPAVIHKAMTATLLHPRAPDLLQQMKIARAKAQAQ